MMKSYLPSSFLPACFPSQGVNTFEQAYSTYWGCYLSFVFLKYSRLMRYCQQSRDYDQEEENSSSRSLRVFVSKDHVLRSRTNTSRHHHRTVFAAPSLNISLSTHTFDIVRIV